MKSLSPRFLLAGLLALVLSLAFVPPEVLAAGSDVFRGFSFVTSTGERNVGRIDNIGATFIYNQRLNPVAFLTNATLTVFSGNQIRIGAVAGNTTCTIPSAVTAGNGYVLDAQDVGGLLDATHTVTFASTSGNINGASTKNLATAYSGLRFISDGTNWFCR